MPEFSFLCVTHCVAHELVNQMELLHPLVSVISAVLRDAVPFFSAKCRGTLEFQEKFRRREPPLIASLPA